MIKLKEKNLENGKTRAVIEQFVSNNPDIYSVEDDNFLYYAQDVANVRVFHIVKGKLDYSMDIRDWEKFIDKMHIVNDEYFVTGEGKHLKDSFLGKYLAKYSRRKTFIDDLAYIVNDAKVW